MISHNGITAFILSGGRGLRMGGVDKGLQHWHGTPLALNALRRLKAQQGGAPFMCVINANRNLAAYEAFGVPVWPDRLNACRGPLEGFLTALQQAQTPYVLTVPCDTPLFPLDLVDRMAQAFDPDNTDIVMASALDDTGHTRPQPVFCLLPVLLLDSLVSFTRAGGRKIDQWTTQHRQQLVAFNQPGDDPRAFANVNTLPELEALQRI